MDVPRLEPLNRSRREEDHSISDAVSQSLLTSAATVQVEGHITLRHAHSSSITCPHGHSTRTCVTRSPSR